MSPSPAIITIQSPRVLEKWLGGWRTVITTSGQKSTMLRKTSSGLVVVLFVIGSVFAGSAVAASAPSVTASPDDPDANATYSTTITVGNESEGSLNGYQVDLSNSGADVSNVGINSVKKVGIDRGDNASGTKYDVNVSDDLSSVETSNNGKTVTFKFGGSYSLKKGDEIVIVFEDVINPSSSGEYAVPLDINPQSSGGEATASLTIDGADQTSTSTESSTDTPIPTETQEEETTTPTEETKGAQQDTETPTQSAENEESGGSGGSSESTSSQVPGFGVGIAVLALVGAALIAARR